MERLRSPLSRRHSLDAGARHIVEHILRREAPSAGLAMGAQRERALVFGSEASHQLRPQHARGAHLGDLHEEVHPDGPEEREPWREGIDIEPRRDSRLHILDAVGECVGEFEIGGRARLLHVIAGDRDRIELRHALRCVGEDVRDDAHRLRRRIDISVPHHELFEDVVLDGALELFWRHALLLARHDEEREDRQHRAVHGHRHGHPVERNAIEERAHIVDRIDGDACHPHIAGHAGMIGVVAAMGGEIEGDGKPHLPGGEIAPVEGVRIFRRRKSRILPDGPGLRCVHRRIGPAQEGRDAGEGADEIEAGRVAGGVGGFNGDGFGGEPNTTFLPPCGGDAAEGAVGESCRRHSPPDVSLPATSPTRGRDVQSPPRTPSQADKR